MATTYISKIQAIGSADEYIIKDAEARSNLDSHVHGNISRDGKVSQTATIASGDKLLIADSSNSDTVIGSAITFNTAATEKTKALSRNGTWESYLPLAGGTMTGGVTFVGNQSSAFNEKGIIFTNGSRIGENSSKALGLYSGSTFYIRPDSATSSSGKGIEISSTTMYPTVTNEMSLGDSSHKWTSVYATTFSGNATSATGFASAKSIALTGDVIGSATGGNGSNGWSIATTIGTGKVTNAMLAGSIANGKLANSKVTIAGTDVSLGGSLDAATLKTNLGLNNAMHYIGKATVAITDGSTTDPKIGGNATTLVTGDVIIDSTDAREYVWNGTKWELLGNDSSSYKVTQEAVSKPTAVTNKWVSAIGQNANGNIDVSYTTLDTSGTWSGTATKATGDGDGNTISSTYIKKSTLSGAYDIMYSSAANTPTRLAANTTTTKKFLRMTGTGSAGAAPAWDTVTKSDVGLGNVENTALSTWTGSSNITTIGTLSSGTVPWARLSNVPSSFTPSAHTHYWASIETTSAAAYNTAPEMATLKLNGNTSASAASTSNVTLVFDTTLQALNFVFA